MQHLVYFVPVRSLAVSSRQRMRVVCRPRELHTFRSFGSWNFPQPSEPPWNLHTAKQREYTARTRRNWPFILKKAFFMLIYIAITNTYLYQKLNSYTDRGERKMCSSCGSTNGTCFTMTCYTHTAYVRPWADSQAKPIHLRVHAM